MKTASILITAFLRPELLKWSLQSLSKQVVPFEFETVLLHDGLPVETENLCKQFEEKLNLKSVDTEQRNSQNFLSSRVSGFALKIGIRHAEGQVLVISRSEIFHLNNTLAYLVLPVLGDNKMLATSIVMVDSGSFLKSLHINGQYSWNAYGYSYQVLGTSPPFLMAIDRQEMIDIEAFDESSTASALDGSGFIGRLINNGCYMCLTQAQTIHL